jgi:hypothetical protein
MVLLRSKGRDRFNDVTGGERIMPGEEDKGKNNETRPNGHASDDEDGNGLRNQFVNSLSWEMIVRP